jgi:ATP-dependent exoDNAse (exonuclease V) beta subunit
MFNHVPVELQPITATNKNGVRLYETPEGNKYPSITTVLSVRNKQGLTEWRKRVGDEVANHISRTAAARGTKVHHMCEDYLNNVHLNFPSKWKEHKKNFLPYCLFSQLKSVLSNIDNIYAQEAGLYSDKYKVAGRVDCVAEYKGTLSIIDFKTSTKEKNDEWNENYYIQGSAYAEMFGERTGIEISQVVILVVTEDGTVQEFIKNKQEYLNRLSETIKTWSEENVK